MLHNAYANRMVPISLERDQQKPPFTDEWLVSFVVHIPEADLRSYASTFPWLNFTLLRLFLAQNHQIEPPVRYSYSYGYFALDDSQQGNL
jgi:hypothetical protein